LPTLIFTFPENQTHCIYVWQHKYVKAQWREDDVSARLPRMWKSRTHEQNRSSKTYSNGCNC